MPRPPESDAGSVSSEEGDLFKATSFDGAEDRGSRRRRGEARSDGAYDAAAAATTPRSDRGDKRDRAQV